MRPFCMSTWPVPVEPGAAPCFVRCELLEGHTGHHEHRSREGVYTWARAEQPPAGVPAADAAALSELAQAAAELQAAIGLASAFAPTNARQLGAFLALQGFRRVTS